MIVGSRRPHTFPWDPEHFRNVTGRQAFPIPPAPSDGKRAYLFLIALSNGSPWLGQAGAEFLNELELLEPSPLSGPAH